MKKNPWYAPASWTTDFFPWISVHRIKNAKLKSLPVPFLSSYGFFISGNGPVSQTNVLLFAQVDKYPNCQQDEDLAETRKLQRH
jgi:hypothetical protein